MAFEIIKKSKLRSRIEQMLADGISARKISAWTKRQGEYINYLTIHKYKKEEFNFIRAALEEVGTTANGTTESPFEVAKARVVADIEFCNRVLSVASEKIEEFKDDPKASQSFRIFCEAGMKAIELKRKIEQDGGDQDATIINVANFNFGELETEIKQELATLKELESLETKGVVEE